MDTKNKIVLIDSDVLIWWLRGREDVVKDLSSLLIEAELLTTVVNVAEIWAGVRKGEEQMIDQLFKNMKIININEAIGKLAGYYLNEFNTSYKIELGDALIAACATIHNTSLWTFNKKHYPMLKKGMLL